LIALLLIIVGVLGLASFQPNTFRVERSAMIKASPDKVFALINNFHQWEGWSPWAKLDPAMKSNYSGAANGKGAVYEWAGNSKVGQGRMEIIDATPSSKITIKLDFIAPFAAHNTAEFTMVPQGDMTNVTWAMLGSSPFLTKVIGLFCSMDSMVGKDFEAGLNNLKGLAEK
jgi:carbon monoxide dehydrogenase subunit G